PAKMLAGLKRHGLVGLAVLAGPLRRPLGFARPLAAPSDYRGTSIGFRASGVSDAVLRALGATPIVLPRDNDAAGLHGVGGHVPNMINSFEVRGATLTGNVIIEPRPNVIFMNQRAFGALSAAQQRVLIRAASQARAEGGVYEPDGTSVQQMCRAGLTIVTASRADLAGLEAAVQPVYRKLESNPATKAFIAQITAMRQAVGGAPDAVSCPGGRGRSGQITTTATKLDGKWQVTFTESQLLAAGAGPDEDVPANYGPFMLTFERGHWRQAGPPG